MISPYTHGVKDSTTYTHWSLLRTTEELLGLPLLGNAATANSMDCSSVSPAERVCDCEEGVQCPNERKPIFFMPTI